MKHSQRALNRGSELWSTQRNIMDCWSPTIGPTALCLRLRGPEKINWERGKLFFQKESRRTRDPKQLNPARKECYQLVGIPRFARNKLKIKCQLPVLLIAICF